MSEPLLRVKAQKELQRICNPFLTVLAQRDYTKGFVSNIKASPYHQLANRLKEPEFIYTMAMTGLLIPNTDYGLLIEYADDAYNCDIISPDDWETINDLIDQLIETS